MRCAVYIRVSTNREEQKSSLENQKDLFYRYIADKGWDLYDFYVDVESGTTDKREGLKRLIADAEERKFDVILAKELSRLARNVGLASKIKEIAAKNRIDIITLDNAINTVNGDQNFFGLFAWAYELEAQHTSRRVKDTFRTKASQGEFKGSVPPYGYRIVGGKGERRRLELAKDDTPNVVKRIFRMYLEGRGFDAIARALTREGYPTPAQVIGKANAGLYWHGSSVKLILSNPHYVGDLVQGRQTTRSVTSKVREEVPKDKQIIVPNVHPAIISREDFEAVQRYMQGRKQQQAKPKAKKHLFTNYLYCADCGKSLWYVQHRKGYVCGNYYKHGRHACSQHSVKEKELIDVILHDIKCMATPFNDDLLIKRLELKTKEVKRQAEKQIQTLTQQIEKLKAEKKEFIRLLASRSITEDDYKEITEDNNNKIIELQNKLRNLLSVRNVNDAEMLVKLRQELKQIMSFDNLTPEMVHRLVNKIVVKADGSVNIHYKFTATALI
ncbi:recombinase [Aneurinibacillus sp. XH2]|uniref:recombinase family protein n=1 Tax=Aneurinibacillus sp. XH2 TaxID=1450761 RepID=UPI0007096158|nr:recombinase family protein [Aneurinibacillus sp. XH2]AMA74128.1 recombinase [Aneurinibacillus sp. XH2]